MQRELNNGLDRIVATSCGGLVADLSEEDFSKCRSMPCNRELMRVFRDMELVEQIGSGMSRILKTYDRSIFELTPSFTVVTFPFKKAFITPNDTINDKIKANPTATVLDLAKLMGKSRITILPSTTYPD